MTIGRYGGKKAALGIKSNRDDSSAQLELLGGRRLVQNGRVKHFDLSVGASAHQKLAVGAEGYTERVVRKLVHVARIGHGTAVGRHSEKLHRVAVVVDGH